MGGAPKCPQRVSYRPVAGHGIIREGFQTKRLKERELSNQSSEEERRWSEWAKIRREGPEFVEDLVAAVVRGYRKGQQKDGASQPLSSDQALVRAGEQERVVSERSDARPPIEVVSVSHSHGRAFLLVVIGALLLAGVIVTLVFNLLGFVFLLLSVIFGFLSGLFKVLAGLKWLSVLAIVPVAAIAVVLLTRGRSLIVGPR